ncbi:ATP-binding protein [Microvirga tunisiensis]|nr:ATP-binding protein [Microvirga tunisiensis]
MDTVDLNIQPFSLRLLVNEAVSIVSGLLDQKMLSFSLKIDPDVPQLVCGDPDRLRQILLNLLNNAIKFTPRGSIELTVRSESGSEAAPKLLFSVSDTGIGIPEGKQDRLFKRFSQVDSSDRRQYGGTGLGLAISKKLVEIMGGEIGVQSTVGKGSTFWFRLMLQSVKQSGCDGCEAPHADAHRSARVLLVEDSEILQDVARTMLQNSGHQVDVAENGAEGVSAALSGNYDVVLMDVQMPIMDGLSATKHIRSVPGSEQFVPIIALTANTLPHELVAMRDAGMNDYISKPFRRDDLLEVIDKWVFSQTPSVG